eukprot:184186_1
MSTVFVVLWLLFRTLLAKKPNVIIIVSDDLGYDDLNFQSHQIQTPNINYFVDNGQFLSFHYAQSICSPSRAALMTGRYPLHTGINDWIQSTQSFGVPLNNTMLPKILYNAGYDTHMVGKWHLGFYKWPYTPTFRGYKSYYGYYTGGEDYFTHKAGGYYDFRNDMGINCGGNCSQVAVNAYQNYSANLFSDRAIEVIVNHSTHSDTKDTPLFLYLAYQSVHAPGEVPSYWVEPYTKTIPDKKRRNFAGMVSVMDSGIGNITATLKKYGFLGNDGNTIVIFSADNGGPTTTGDSVGASNYPLRGGKHSIWEGGTRVTAWFYATPDIVSPNLATIGKNYSQLMHMVDWLPTVLEAAGVSHTFPPGLEIDGVSHWKGLISGNKYNDAYFNFRDNIYYGKDDNANPRNVGYRYQWYKIFNSSGGNPSAWSPNDNASNGEYIYQENELWDCWHTQIKLKDVNVDAVHIPLYNISNDYSERHDISGQNQDLVNQLIDKMHALQATGIPQAKNDKNCPNITHPVYPVVGGVWQPWC